MANNLAEAMIPGLAEVVCPVIVLQGEVMHIPQFLEERWGVFYECVISLLH